MQASASLFLGGLFYINRQSNANSAGPFDPLSLGKSKDKFMEVPKTGITFDDVAGVDGAKLELQEVVDFLKNPQKYTNQKPFPTTILVCKRWSCSFHPPKKNQKKVMVRRVPFRSHSERFWRSTTCPFCPHRKSSGGELGAKIPKGALLAGPPGTGKSKMVQPASHRGLRVNCGC